MRKKITAWMLVVVSLLVCVVTVRGNTVIKGTFKYPNGVGVNGLLILQLTGRTVLNTCVTPAMVVPNTPIVLQLVNGLVQGTSSVVPSECMSPMTSYDARLYDNTHALLLDTQWYVENDTVNGVDVGTMSFVTLGGGPLAAILVSKPVLQSPGSSQVVAQPTGTTFTFSGPGSTIFAPGTLATAGTCGAGTKGALATITDSNTTTWGATIAGSSTNVVLGFCDGTNWTVAAK